MSDRPQFELGLVMAGAISAGAYTAGVMDFLIEALDGYYAARDRPDWNGPRHDVRVPVLAGASAGGMTSAISAVQFMHDTAHLRPGQSLGPERARSNQLYHSWVQQIDIAKLLGTEDVEQRKALVSALDSTALWDIASGALEVAGPRRRRPWVADPLAVFLTVANLRGMPYGFKLYGTKASDAYGMTNHMDDMRFAVTWEGEAPAGFVALRPDDCPGGNWQLLARAALATGAFPMGLSPQVLKRKIRDYFGRPDLRDPAVGDDAPEDYEFVCVDGGLMNNEPLEQARRYLAGGDRHNPREGEAARRAVIMIDPFPNHIRFDPEADNDDRLFSVAPRMFNALVNQARFKPEELALAEDDDVYSRFIISPSRREADGRQAEYAIASATLGGFGGFFEESFRRHDYLLGRRNCQSFLKRYLALPETNPLFAEMSAAQKQAWQVKERDGTPRRVPAADGNSHPALPVIPLPPELQADEQALPEDRPRPEQVDLDGIRRQVRARVKALAGTTIDEELGSILPRVVRWGAKAAMKFSLEKKLTDKVMAKLTEGLSPLGPLGDGKTNGSKRR
ncbi:MAG: patatin-like phospholipase family protein [Kiloniellaceae bacterium]